jgi:ParB family transcriptional regulator, chromosome partitioning protein
MWLNVPESDGRSPEGASGKVLIFAGSAKRRQRAALALIPLSAISPNPEQPRKRFDEERIAELAESISRRGVLQPVLVRSAGGGRYELLAGERRFRASQRAGLAVVPALVREEDDPLELALIENLQREDLTPLEEAEALHGLSERHGYSHRELAEIVGKSRPYVSNVLSLLRLPDRVKEEIHREGPQVSRELLMGVARTGSPEEAEALWGRLKLDLMSVRRFREERSGTPAPARSAGREIMLATRRLNRVLKRLAEDGESVEESERDSVRRALRKSMRLIQRQLALT